MRKNTPGALSDDELLELLRLRFSPDEEGRCPRTFDDISGRNKRFQQLDEPTLSRAVQYALSQRNQIAKIRVERIEVRKPIERIPTSEERLRAKFADLTSAFVIRPHLPPTLTEAERSDEIHRQLGQAMAEELSSGNFIDEQKRVGLGSGRAVYHTVSHLANLPPFNTRKLTLVPLAGALYPQHHAILQNIRLDADYHVQLLASRFRYPIEQIYITHPLVAASPDAVLKVLRKGPWKSPPDVGIVGIGVLAAGHRLYQIVKMGAAHKDPMFDLIYKPLRDLITLSERHTHRYCPIVDVANHLMYVANPDGPTIPEADSRRMKAAVASINARTIAYDEDRFGKLGRLILIAGTPRKAAAINFILQRGNAKVLCTDAETADLICAM